MALADIVEVACDDSWPGVKLVQISTLVAQQPVSYTHLDVYKRQPLMDSDLGSKVVSWRGPGALLGTRREEDFRCQFDMMSFVAQPDHTILNGALQAHGTFRQAGQRLSLPGTQGEHPQILLLSLIHI